MSIGDYSGTRRQRNWRAWWFSYLAHYAQGGLVGLLVPWPLNMILAYLGYSQYQEVEYARLRDLRDAEYEGKAMVGDWPSIDLMDRLTGLWVGIGAQVVVVAIYIWRLGVL